MGRRYSQLSLEERIELYCLRRKGLSFRRIAACLERDVSTISREWRRNGQARAKKAGDYCPAAADRRARGRRRRDKRFKLARQPSLRRQVKTGLAMGWSPAQIAGRLALAHGGPVISHESIYRYIYHRSSDNYKDYWHRSLPLKKHRRGRIVRGLPGPLAHLRGRVSIHARPDHVSARRQAGHWEVDLMLFSRYGQNVIVACERKTRFIRLMRLKGRTSGRVAARLLAHLRALPPEMRRSATFDNGTEFAQHRRLSKAGVAVYFCDVRAPWQKGSVENAIGRLRRWLPRTTNVDALSPQKLAAIVRRFNTTPRKCLGYKTPLEAYKECCSTVALQT